MESVVVGVHEHSRRELYYLWICLTWICQGISTKVEVTAYGDPQHFEVMTFAKYIRDRCINRRDFYLSNGGKIIQPKSWFT